MTMKKFSMMFLLCLIVACGKTQTVKPDSVVKVCPRQARPVLIVKQDLNVRDIAINYESVVKSYLQLEETLKCYEE